MDEFCASPQGSLLVNGVVNACYAGIYIPAGLFVLLLVIIIVNLVQTSRKPTGAIALVTGIDKCRVALCCILTCVQIARLVISIIADTIEILDAELIAAGIRLAGISIIAVYFHHEVQRGILESCSLKIWMLLELLALVPLFLLAVETEDGSDHIRPVSFCLYVFEGVALVSLLVAYCMRAGRCSSQPLLDEADRRLDRTISTRAPSPQTLASIPSQLFFFWFTPLVTLANEKGSSGSKLDESDVFPLRTIDLSETQSTKLQGYWDQQLQKPEPSLLTALIQSFGWDVLATAWLKLIGDCVGYLGPVFLNRILSALSSDDLSFKQTAYAYAVGIAGVSLIKAFSQAHYFQQGNRNGMHIRAALINVVYKKSLRILPWPTPKPQETPNEDEQKNCCGKKKHQKPTPGNDGIGKMTSMISSDTDKFTFLMPMINQLWGAPLQLMVCLFMLTQYVGVAILGGLVVMVLMIIVSNFFRAKALVLQKEATKVKDQRLKLELELMKIIKIVKLYAWETDVYKRIKQVRDHEVELQLKYKFWNSGINMAFNLSPILVALSTFGIYVCLLEQELDAATAFTSLSLFDMLNFPLTVFPMMVRFFLEAWVSSERIESFLLAPEVAGRPPIPQQSEVTLEVKVSKLQWPDKTLLLDDLNIAVKTGEMLAIVGRTGSGKSGLVNAMLGELPLGTNTGYVSLRGTVGYCAQSAWIRNATIKENITGLEKDRGVDEARYAQVVKDCALDTDLRGFPSGDQTPIGDRGVNLSGGQKQRIAIARAVYSDPDVYIFDDIFSALDAHVTSQICDDLFGGPLMQGKTKILVTHSLKALPLANDVALLQDNKVAFHGTFEKFRASRFMDELGHVEKAEAPIAVENQAKTGESKDAVSVVKKEDKTKPASSALKKEDRAQGAVSWDTYKAYANASGGIGAVMVFIFAVVLSEGSKNGMDLYLASWSSHGGAASGMILYAMFGLISAVGFYVYIYARIKLGQNASQAMHEKCVESLLRAKMNWYDVTPFGQITNRLSEDTNLLDYNLPQTMGANFSWGWKSLFIGVTVMLVGWYLVFVMVPLIYLYWIVNQSFLPAIRDLRRLDAAAKSPIFSHFSETMNGVSTVRAMQLQGHSFRMSIHKLERQMEAFYLNNTAARWLSLRLQFLSTILVALVAIIGAAASINWGLQAATVGLSLSYAMKLTETLNQFFRESADRESQMVSVERMQNYCVSLPLEAPLQLPDDDQIPSTWPQRGDVHIEDLKMRYRDDLPFVLDGVSLNIKGGERIGVVGRTGCGKSSLLITLMRICEADEGKVEMDSVDVKTVGLHVLRGRTAIIPQDPAILTATVKYNLDPTGRHSEEELWDVLEKAQLKSRVESADGKLESMIEEGGGNYSIGEMQLLCLARALLRRMDHGGLLLLDEATSSLDNETDKIIQDVIRKQFNCTTITIAHRIQTLMDYDRIVVLNQGKVEEFDTPKNLLQRESKFRSLAVEAGVI